MQRAEPLQNLSPSQPLGSVLLFLMAAELLSQVAESVCDQRHWQTDVAVLQVRTVHVSLEQRQRFDWHCPLSLHCCFRSSLQVDVALSQMKASETQSLL